MKCILKYYLQKFPNIFKSCNFKENFILFDYKFTNIFNSYGVNLGDFIQSIAVKNILLKLYPNINIILCDRDSLTVYKGKPAFTIMQGWFAHDNKFVPNNKIIPIFIGTHITIEMQKYLSKFISDNSEYFKNKIIGCRDKNTLEYFKKQNINSYLSRCLTLTFPKRIISPNQNKVFIVNIPEKLQSYIPQDLFENAEIINQRFVDKGLKKTYYLKNSKKYFNQAEQLLNKYRDEARLVITTALHCAAPCTAMGIPVVLISETINNIRFSTLDGIIKIYSIDDLKQGNINYSVQAPNIEDLKTLMIKNVDLTIKQVFDASVSDEYLCDIREKIENYKII